MATLLLCFLLWNQLKKALIMCFYNPACVKQGRHSAHQECTSGNFNRPATFSKQKTPNSCEALLDFTLCVK